MRNDIVGGDYSFRGIGLQPVFGVVTLECFIIIFIAPFKFSFINLLQISGGSSILGWGRQFG